MKINDSQGNDSEAMADAEFRAEDIPAGLAEYFEPVGNTHNTVKSIALMRWLVDLVTVRDDLVIDPFGGSGTTGAACLASGRRVILIERDPRFAEIARQRCAHWGAEWSAPARASKRRAKRAADAGPQGDLFAARTEPAK